MNFRGDSRINKGERGAGGEYGGGGGSMLVHSHVLKIKAITE